MTGKTTRRVKRTGKSLAFKVTTIGVIFLGMIAAVEQATIFAGMSTVPFSTIAAAAAFVTGIATQRYLL